MLKCWLRQPRAWWRGNRTTMRFNPKRSLPERSAGSLPVCLWIGSPATTMRGTAGSQRAQRKTRMVWSRPTETAGAGQKSGSEDNLRCIGARRARGQRFFQQAHHPGRGRAVTCELAAVDGDETDMVRIVRMQDGFARSMEHRSISVRQHAQTGEAVHEPAQVTREITPQCFQ